MNTIADWLRGMERLAADCYDGAADYFSEDEKIARFLKHLAADERWHLNVIEKAAEYLSKRPGPVSSLALDPVTTEKAEAPLRACKDEISAGTLAKDSLLERIVAVEFSEWNDIFLYVIRALREQGREFSHVASKVQHHKRHIEKFIGSLPEGRVFLATIKSLAPVWNAKILVVDDYPEIREFLSAVLSSEGTVQTAENGKEGLENVSEQYFDVVLSDITMPVMNGIEFYRQALQYDPNLGGRILFLPASSSDDEHIDFLEKNGLKYLVKPMRINAVKEAVHNILIQTPKFIAA